MSFEVEQKYRVDDLDLIVDQIVALGGVRQDKVRQVDLYLAHPSREFAETDEALRLRRVGETNVVTYKGPKLDHSTKTRREIELPLADGGPSFEDWTQMLTILGFSPVAEVAKWRTPYQLEIEGRTIELALDEVDQLGSYVEIETIANESQLDAARDAIARLAAQLQLREPERRGYIQMLLAAM